MRTTAHKSWIGGILAAFAASLCCTAPLVAIFGGIGAKATSFNWIGPYRPYLIAITVLGFAFAWYQQLSAVSNKVQDCCESAKRSFWQTKKFLLIATLFASVLMVLPYYDSWFYQPPRKMSVAAYSQHSMKYVRLTIRGMSCADCTHHINRMLVGLNGVVTSVTSFEKQQTLVQYNPAKTTVDSISHKINEIGYRSTLIKTN